MSKLDATLRSLGYPVHLDDDGRGDPWVQTGPDAFQFVIFGMSGPRMAHGALTRAQVESHCGRLVPLPD
jgi:hypothetical protein